jgi:triacylglycerol lipase
VSRLRWLFADVLPVEVLDLRVTETAIPHWTDTHRLARIGHAPRYPIVFCHGMLALSLLRMNLPRDLNYLSGLRPLLEGRGIRALFPQVAPTSGVETRAKQLREQMAAWGDGPVNLIAHSMGGLDARYLITHLGMAHRVRSLTTVCTPHQGSAFAEWFLTHFRENLPILQTLEQCGINTDAFRDCQRPACRVFNEKTPNIPGIGYFSYGASVPMARVSPMLRRPWNVLMRAEGPNDGLVSLQSARWGEYLGTLEVDHFAQTPDRMYIRPDEDFDSPGFFLQLVDELARRGY